MKENILNKVPLKIYRYLRWRHDVDTEYRFNRKHFSEEYAMICRQAKRAERSARSAEDTLHAFEKKDTYILQYLEHLCSEVITSYRANPPITQVRKDNIIWVYWWTGETSAPDIVKACISSIRRNANGREVIMLDQSNYLDFISLPDYLIRKHEAGIIGHAHFSDIVRMSLLALYGGIWIDATVFLSQPLPDVVFDSEFYTLKTFDCTVPYYSKSRWCGYFLAGQSNFLLFPFARDCLLKYWEYSDCIIDYLLMDYVFGIACSEFPEVAKTIDQLPDNNTLRGRLMNAINEPYSKELYDSLCTQDTFASKLSWRYGNPRTHTADGILTNYGHLLSL